MPSGHELRVPPEGRWRGLAALLLLFFGSLLGAAVLAPWALRTAHGLAELWPTRPTLYLADKELPRYFDRFRWLVVLAGLSRVARAAGVRSWKDLGLFRGALRRTGAWRWLAVGIGMVLLLVLAQIVAGGAGVREGAGWGRTAEVVVLALVSAIFVAGLEEIVFRGVVLRAFLSAVRTPALAVPLAAGFFALVHFQRVPSDAWTAARDPTIRDGLAVAGESLTALAASVAGDPLVFLGLFLAGNALCLLVLRSGSIAPAIGLHAGWVWAGLVQRRLVARTAEATSPIWGGKALVDGTVPLLFLLVLTGWLALGLRAADLGTARSRSD